MITTDRLRPRHQQWIKSRTMHPWVEDTRGIVALRRGQLVGAFIFDSCTGYSANVHFCLDTPMVLKTDFLNVGFSYAYNILGLGVLFAGIPGTNIRMCRLAERVGFKPLGELENAIGPGVDRIIYQMLRDECTWLQQSEAA